MTAEDYKRERILRGTQEEVANALGVTLSTIYRRERLDLPNIVSREAWLALLMLPVREDFQQEQVHVGTREEIVGMLVSSWEKRKHQASEKRKIWIALRAVPTNKDYLRERVRRGTQSEVAKALDISRTTIHRRENALLSENINWEAWLALLTVPLKKICKRGRPPKGLVESYYMARKRETEDALSARQCNNPGELQQQYLAEPHKRGRPKKIRTEYMIRNQWPETALAKNEEDIKTTVSDDFSLEDVIVNYPCVMIVNHPAMIKKHRRKEDNRLGNRLLVFPQTTDQAD